MSELLSNYTKKGIRAWNLFLGLLLVDKKYFFVIALLFAVSVGTFTPAHNADAFWPVVFWAAAALFGGGYVATEFLGVSLLPAFMDVLNSLLFWLAALSAYIVAGLGWLFDFVLLHTVVQNKLASVSAIQVAWQHVRDLANIFFIFILLAIGIATILRLQSYGMKSLLARLIIVALLVNFSLFATKIVIDVSNLTATQIYKGITVETNGISDRNNPFYSSEGIGWAIIQGTGLPKLWQNQNAEEKDKGRVAMILFFIVAFQLVVAWALWKGTLLFIGRFIAFSFLMILSPLAFLLSVLPATRRYFNQWLEKLITQAIVAPFYMFVLFIVLKIISGNFSSGGIFNERPQPGGGSAQVSFEIEALFNFIVIVGLLLIGVKQSMALAGSIGAHANKAGSKISGMFRGLVGGVALGGAGLAARKVVGGTAARLARSKGLAGQTAKGGVRGWAGQLAYRGLDKTTGTKFGTKRSYDSVLKDRQKHTEKTAKRISEPLVLQKRSESDIDFAKRKSEAEERGRQRRAEYVSTLPTFTRPQKIIKGGVAKKVGEDVKKEQVQERKKEGNEKIEQQEFVELKNIGGTLKQIYQDQHTDKSGKVDADIEVHLGNLDSDNPELRKIAEKELHDKTKPIIQDKLDANEAKIEAMPKGAHYAHLLKPLYREKRELEEYSKKHTRREEIHRKKLEREQSQREFGELHAKLSDLDSKDSGDEKKGSEGDKKT